MGDQQIWQAALGELELTLSRANFTTWFKNTFISSRQEGSIIIGVPNTFTKVWLEKKYHQAILKALQKITNNEIKIITYKVEVKPKTLGETTISQVQPNTELIQKPEVFERHQIDTPPPPSANEFGLNPKYTFASFVVGKANEFAQAASMAVAQKPGKVYNPLFIYGGVGLGKTHLAQAIGNEVIKNDRTKKVLYVSCEKFTSDFIKSISSNRSEVFKKTYRSVDILLIDDIQFLAGKEGTQEAFFHTFNDLHQANKQVVITSDRPPKSIPALESRLVSRFEWGMIADISAPDMETRSAILRTKCEERNYKLNDDIIGFIAGHIHNNVRELEGALNKIIATHQFNNTTPTPESVKKILNSLSSVQRKNSITPKQIITTISEFYDITIEDLLGSCRKKTLTLPRQIVMYLMREELKSSFPAIGHEIGERDHTTAMHAHSKISKAIDEDEKINQDIKLVKEKLYN